MRYVGYSEFFHDASLAIVNDNGNIDYASLSERYSKRKHDNIVHQLQVRLINDKDFLCFYENPELRLKHAIHLNPDEKFIYKTGNSVVRQRFKNAPHNLKNIDHHMSHAALAYYTRPWETSDDTVILSVDGVGEYKSAVIYDNNFNELYSEKYPKSLGFFYSMATAFLDYSPLSDEYIVMGLSSYGEDTSSEALNDFYNSLDFDITNPNWVNVFKEELNNILLNCNSNANVAKSIQVFTENKLIELATKARGYGKKLVYAGGVAENILANTRIKDLFDDMWIPPAPGDGGSSLGVAAYYYAKENNKDRINWKDPYLGHEMGPINPKEVANYIVNKKPYCGIASGRAEFGPRALGNRSLIADVRYDLKDNINRIKKREEFRPFGPAILEEFADEYFDGHMNEYMQYVCKAKHNFNAVTHVDGTARVQIVKQNCTSVLRKILEEYYELTGVAMLLNTSLNVKGEPMLNNKYDAYYFENTNNIKVFYNDTY